VKLVVQDRAVLGSAESRRLRRRGVVPGVLYGREQPIPIAVSERDLRAALGGAGGAHAVLDVVVGSGKTHSSVLKEFQQDPVRGSVTHVDLQEVRLDQPIHAAVAVVLVGDARGVREGGVLTQVTTNVNVQALPLEIPEHLELDVTELGVGDSARLSQLRVPDGVTILDDVEETVVATVSAPRAEEPEPTEAAEGAEAVEGGAPEADEPQGDAATGEGEAAGTAEG